MLVKCAVQVNQCYEEINQIQCLLLMNFFISCWLLSLVCSTGQVGSSFSSSFVTSFSGGFVSAPPDEEGKKHAFLWRALSHGLASDHGFLNAGNLLVRFDTVRIQIPRMR